MHNFYARIHREPLLGRIRGIFGASNNCFAAMQHLSALAALPIGSVIF
jgi:hypothetical protein